MRAATVISFTSLHKGHAAFDIERPFDVFDPRPLAINPPYREGEKTLAKNRYPRRSGNPEREKKRAGEVPRKRKAGLLRKAIR